MLLLCSNEILQAEKAPFSHWQITDGFVIQHCHKIPLFINDIGDL